MLFSLLYVVLHVSLSSSLSLSLSLSLSVSFFSVSLPQPGECPVVLEVSQEPEDEGTRAAVLPVQGISVGSAHSESFSAGPICFS